MQYVFDWSDEVEAFYASAKNLDFNWSASITPLTEHTLGVRKMYLIREDWLAKLRLVFCRATIESPPSESQIQSFALYLINYQQMNAHNLKGFFSMIDSEAESDARVDFIYFPCYIAMSTK